MLLVFHYFGANNECSSLLVELVVQNAMFTCNCLSRQLLLLPVQSCSVLFRSSSRKYLFSASSWLCLTCKRNQDLEELFEKGKPAKCDCDSARRCFRFDRLFSVPLLVNFWCFYLLHEPFLQYNSKIFPIAMILWAYVECTYPSFSYWWNITNLCVALRYLKCPNNKTKATHVTWLSYLSVKWIVS